MRLYETKEKYFDQDVGLEMIRTTVHYVRCDNCDKIFLGAELDEASRHEKGCLARKAVKQ